MPRRTMHFAKGGYYHIYNRGIARQTVFRDHQSYAYALKVMRQVAAEYEIAVIAYCILPNHYHWLVRQDGEMPAGRLPQRVFASYTQMFHRLFKTSGRLFQGPYCATQVDTDAYLRYLCHYIHGNPVKHGLVATPEMWPYSNYLDWLGKRDDGLTAQQYIYDHIESPDQYAIAVWEYLTGHASLP